jgi:natural product biosynthesis luciferase-like monooxygenase protein
VVKAPSGVPLQNPLDFSLFYFSRSAEKTSDGYRLLTDGARFADDAGLLAVWLPERHFHEFGGLYPNPSVLAASLASITKRVRLRAGSVVLPLHHPARVAEEWAVVDHLSGGRVDLSFVRGWGPNDFALAPQSYADRDAVMLEKLDQVRRLWRGEAVIFENGQKQQTPIKVYPRPVQAELPTWLTCTRGDDRFVEAGRLGTNVLTALLLQSPDELEQRIALYRRARQEHGFDPKTGRVTLMLHTFVGDNEAEVRRLVRGPLEDYLRSSVELWRTGSKLLDDLSDADRERMLAYALERYMTTSSLIGTPERCLTTANRFRSMGVDEIACLIDFGVSDDQALAALKHLPKLQRLCSVSDHLPASVELPVASA